MVNVEEEELLIEETEPNDDDEVQNLRYDIMPYPADYTVKGLYDRWQSGLLVTPGFQRRFVWSQVQQSRFIESFLLGLPVPQVFLYRDQQDPKLAVIDGQQRIGTIARFYSGELRLRGVDSRWNGRVYEDLSEYDRSELDESTLRAIIIRQVQPNDNSSIYHIFERLNTGGIRLNEMEIRRALFRGEANPLLEKLNDNSDWRSLIGSSEPDRRFRDVELVLRILALAHGWRDYGKPMKNFITTYMQVLDGATSQEIAQLEQRFVEACARVSSELGEKPFHIRNRLNMAAMDSVMACTVELSESLGDDLGGAYNSLLSNETFMEAVTHNTSDSAALTQRFQLVHSAFGA